MRTDEDTISAARALRELARLVADNDIDSAELAEFVRSLLCDQLIELHASCRIEAIRISRSGEERKSAELAKYLRGQARRLEMDRAAAETETAAVQRPVLDSVAIAPAGERFSG